MAETDKHRDLAVYVIEALRVLFGDDPSVYVSGNNFIFYQEGDPGKRVSPDAYVVFSAGMRQRDSYKAWEEGGRLPDVVFEFTSRKTRREDTDTKRPLYEQVLRVPEYFLFDPTGDYLAPRLQGYRLGAERYAHILPENGRIRSEQLGLDLVEQGEQLRLWNPLAGQWLLSPMEQSARASQEAAARQRAEDEVARLRAELEALRSEGRS